MRNTLLILLTASALLLSACKGTGETKQSKQFTEKEALEFL
jgi:protein involved in sex pheromone biosynthesis